MSESGHNNRTSNQHKGTEQLASWLRSDGFDSRMLVEAPEDRDEALSHFLKDLLSQCDAAALPPTSTQGDTGPKRFESLEAYMRTVLQVAPTL